MIQKQETIRFDCARTCEELIKALQQRVSNAQNSNNGRIIYLYHYTKLSAAISIIRNKKWFLGAPTKMNDGLELTFGDSNDWEKLFFASFMQEPQESIAMWSMYAQPWSDGVIIKIPIKEFKRWIKQSNFRICRADPFTKESLEEDISKHSTVSSYAVAYTNSWFLNKNEEEKITCGVIK